MWPWVTENPKQQWLEQNVFNSPSFESRVTWSWDGSSRAPSRSLPPGLHPGGMLETSTPSILSVHHASANDNVQSGCPCLIISFQPVEREEMRSPSFQDTSWKLPSIDWNVATWPQWLQGRMGNVIPILDGHTFWVFYWGRRGNRYWSNYAAAAYSCHIPVPVTSNWESEKTSLFCLYSASILSPPPSSPDSRGRFIWPLTHTFQRRQQPHEVCRLLPTCHLSGDCCYAYLTRT